VRFFKNYCVAEFTPEQIESNAEKIARAVKVVLSKTILSNTEMELIVTDNKEEVLTKNPLASMSSSSLYNLQAVSAMSQSSNLEEEDVKKVRTEKDEKKIDVESVDVKPEIVQALLKENKDLLQKAAEFAKTMITVQSPSSPSLSLSSTASVS
jgi:hypothetical protein